MLLCCLTLRTLNSGEPSIGLKIQHNGPSLYVSPCVCVCLFVLRFYGPVNPVGSCRARSVYLTTRLLGRLSPLSG